VKKPKLDQHRSRCHTGFDCIDCHTTFNTPGEYKGHTQCISEAEKYQKSLYKGPKTAAQAPKNNYPPRPAEESNPPPQSWSSRGRGGGRGGGYGGRGGGRGWGQSRTPATGGNDTPLGTPTRISPAPVPATVPDLPAVPQDAVKVSEVIVPTEKEKKAEIGGY